MRDDVLEQCLIAADQQLCGGSQEPKRSIDSAGIMQLDRQRRRQQRLPIVVGLFVLAAVPLGWMFGGLGSRNPLAERPAQSTTFGTESAVEQLPTLGSPWIALQAELRSLRKLSMVTSADQLLRHSGQLVNRLTNVVQQHQLDQFREDLSWQLAVDRPVDFGF